MSNKKHRKKVKRGMYNNLRYAPRIARKISDSVNLYRCPVCGEFVYPSDRYCSGCGQRIIFEKYSGM